ncbi:decaprenyl-phosphate phosphoribosyltransferase [Patescibacteria group bacterium]|nr:decaprenyl-phosphate phosphoribosyltransferase [Patescibacteria group bacterium]
MNLIKLLRNYLRLLRPRQWTKNLAVFAAITFGGNLFNFPISQKVFLGFFIFCGLSSAIYIINDIFDIKKDRLHPFKKFRPLAQGNISIIAAGILALLLGLFSLIFSFLIDPAFFIITLGYLLLQLSYTAFLKQLMIIDILALAAGYILRVYAGEIVSGSHISAWLLLTTISLSLFLVVGKRKSELTLLRSFTISQVSATRKTLSHYSESLLDVYASIFATSTFISYALFTFLENPKGPALSSEFLPIPIAIFLQKKWLMLTIIPVVYGLMRYLQDIYEKHEGESPERVIFSDKQLLAALIIWTILVIGIIYL